MNENMELVLSIFEDCEMAKECLEIALNELKEKDNKIKVAIEEILKEYEKYYKCTKDILKRHEVKFKNKTISKLGAKKGIKKEIAHDNSDTAVADMLIKGISMGSINATKKVKIYEDKAKKEYIKLTKDFLKYQDSAIEQLKNYL